MKKILNRVLSLTTIALISTATSADVTWNFETGSEGWEVTLFSGYPHGGPYHTPELTESPDWHESGGDPGGYISADDGTVGGGHVLFMSAPSESLGDMSGYVGGALEFSLACTPEANLTLDPYVVLVSEEGTSLVHEIAAPATDWTEYVINLDHTQFLHDTSGHPPVSESEFADVMNNLSTVRIPGEWVDSGPHETQHLDSVSFVPEPGTLSLLCLGLLVIARRC